MSLFSGMKISGGSGSKTAKEAPSGDKDATSEERTTSAYGFIAGSKAESVSQKKSACEQGSSHSKFQFIDTTTEKASLTHTKCNTGMQLEPPDEIQTEGDPDFNVDLDLDLDFELDPLRTGCEQTAVLRHEKSDTDLEGIDFSTDVDESFSGRDSQHEEKEVGGKGRIVGGSMPKLDGLEVGSYSEQCQKTSAAGASQFGFISESLPQESVVSGETSNENLHGSNLDGDYATSTVEQELSGEGASLECGHEATQRAAAEPEEGAGAPSSLYDLELDVSDMLEVLQEAQAAADRQLREAQETLISHLEALGHERLTAMHGLIRKQKRLNELHILQAQAVSEEDYEKAEVLTEECTSLEDDLSQIPSITLHQEDAFKNVFKESRGVESRQEEQREQWVKSYEELLAQQEAVIVRVREGRDDDSSEEKKQRHEAQRAELDRTLGHVLLDKDHVTKREAQLLTRIDEKTSDLRETKQSLLSQKTAVQEEIAALEKQLAKLRLEEAGLNDTIAGQDEAIEAVRAGFQDEMSSILEEKSRVEEQEDRLNGERQRLDEREKALAAETSHFQSRIKSEETLLTTISETLGMVRSSSKEREDLNIEELGTEGLSLDLQPCKDVLCLRQKLQNATGVIQSTSALILSNQARLATSKKKVMETEDHIATLQGAKQLAVTTKNFGEAKRVAEEIKVKMAEGQGYQAEVEALSELLKTDKDKVEDLQEQVEKMKVELAEMEKRWELSLLKTAGEMMMRIAKRLEEHGIRESTSNAALKSRMLEIERGMVALLICWLSDRHGLPRPSSADEIIQEFEACEGAGICAETNCDEQRQDLVRSDERSEEVKTELVGLEERLQRAIDKEDYDAAERIQARIDHLQQGQPSISM